MFLVHKVKAEVFLCIDLTKDFYKELYVNCYYYGKALHTFLSSKELDTIIMIYNDVRNSIPDEMLEDPTPNPIFTVEMSKEVFEKSEQEFQDRKNEYLEFYQRFLSLDTTEPINKLIEDSMVTYLPVPDQSKVFVKDTIKVFKGNLLPAIENVSTSNSLEAACKYIISDTESVNRIYNTKIKFSYEEN